MTPVEPRMAADFYQRRRAGYSPNRTDWEGPSSRQKTATRSWCSLWRTAGSAFARQAGRPSTKQSALSRPLRAGRRQQGGALVIGSRSQGVAGRAGASFAADVAGEFGRTLTSTIGLGPSTPSGAEAPETLSFSASGGRGPSASTSGIAQLCGWLFLRSDSPSRLRSGRGGGRRHRA